jgi:hypothetical protein
MKLWPGNNKSFTFSSKQDYFLVHISCLMPTDKENKKALDYENQIDTLPME